MKRALKWLGIAVLVLVLCVAALARYMLSLPWRNECAAPPAEQAAQPGLRTRAAVATSQPLATRAASEILEQGGSAADAAITAALMLAVAEPGNSGLGGGGFALVFDPAKSATTGLDFREQAPVGLDRKVLAAALARDKGALRSGALSVAVPSEWDGLLELHHRFGKKPLADLVAPAIAAAKNGVPVAVEYCARCWVRLLVLRGDPDARRTFLTGSGLCPSPGWELRQPELAATLETLAKGASFEAAIGKKMVPFLRARQSAISDADLARPKVIERPLVSGRFKGHQIVSIGPPASGGLMIIGLLQAYERMRARLPAANPLHLWTEASRLVFLDRAALYGDPDFVRVPVERLASAAYAELLAGRIQTEEPLALPTTVPEDKEGDHTTHLSVVDQDGMAVAMTLTINVPFGSGLVVPGTGVLLNNEMDDFYLGSPNSFGLVGNERNAPMPGKRPLSSMAPTMVFEGKRLMMVLGSPGGSSIPSAVAQVIKNVLEDGADPERAVRAGRIHHQWLPEKLEVEPYFDRAKLPADLSRIASKPMFPIGRVQMVVDTASGWRGVSDCRDQGRGWSGMASALEQQH